MAPWTTAAACPGAPVSAFRPLEAALHTAAKKTLLKLESDLIAPMTSPSVVSQLSQSQILILIKSWTVPHDLPAWPLCFIPFHSPPLTHSAPITLLLKHTRLIFSSFCSISSYHRGFL